MIITHHYICERSSVVHYKNRLKLKRIYSFEPLLWPIQKF